MRQSPMRRSGSRAALPGSRENRALDRLRQAALSEKMVPIARKIRKAAKSPILVTVL